MDTMTIEDTTVQENDVHSEAAKIISSAVKWSAGWAAMPLPYVDLIGLAFVQVKMVRSLAKIYGVNQNDQALQGVIAALLGTIASTTISNALVGSSLKFLPSGGTIVGSVSLLVFGAASTYAIGKVFVRHFEGGGTVSSFSANATKDDLEKEFSSAKPASN
jgi:uncharacterized protein (DUF697 family)